MPWAAPSVVVMLALLVIVAAPVEPPVPYERDLAPWAGQEVAIEIEAEGGARATLSGLQAVAHE